jgi:uncharacterized OB-fold protein
LPPRAFWNFSHHRGGPAAPWGGRGPASPKRRDLPRPRHGGIAFECGDGGSRKMTPPAELDNPDSREYRRGLSEGRVVLQQCVSCGAAQFPPRVICIRCGSGDTNWIDASGRGTIYAVTVCTRAAEPEFEELLPIASALIDLEEGVRVLARCVGSIEQAKTGGVVRVSPGRSPSGKLGLVFSEPTT